MAQCSLGLLEINSHESVQQPTTASRHRPTLIGRRLASAAHLRHIGALATGIRDVVGFWLQNVVAVGFFRIEPTVPIKPTPPPNRCM